MEYRMTLRWVARVGSLVSIGLLLLFFVGEGFDTSNVAPAEWVGLLFFPFGVTLGLILGWRRERAGGGIAVGSLLAFYVVYGLLLNHRWPGGWAFALLALPGPLFLASGLLSHGLRRQAR